MHISKDHDERRSEFLDTAQRLFLEKGYEDTTIAAIIDAVGVSKGAFYHYFASKEELLDAIAERSAVAALACVEPIARDAERGAVDRLNAIFAASTAFKSRERGLVVTFLKVLYDDRNLRLRRRIEQRNSKAIAPVIAGILRSGADSGELAVDSPEDASVMILDLSVSMTERLSNDAILAVEGKASGEAMERVFRYLRGYERAMERIIGAEPDSIRLVDKDVAAILIGETA